MGDEYPMGSGNLVNSSVRFSDNSSPLATLNIIIRSNIMSENYGEVRDNFREHELHNTYDPDCSTCYSEVYQFNHDEKELCLESKN